MTPRQHIRVYDFLRSLGDTPDKVAATLRKNGIKGERKLCAACPIANALKRKFREIPDTLRVGNEYLLIDHETMSLPVMVKHFIDRFDNCAYPDLEEAT